MHRIPLLLALALPLTTPVFALDTHLQLALQFDGNAERNVATYQCDGMAEPLTVEYINADPTYLAFLALDGEKHIFVNVLAASGVRYASGQYIWWTKGAEASLYDLTKGEDAPPVSCLEATETP
jgi:membrane-bound inhibitor of C-type lysozyme